MALPSGTSESVGNSFSSAAMLREEYAENGPKRTRLIPSPRIQIERPVVQGGSAQVHATNPCMPCDPITATDPVEQMVQVFYILGRGDVQTDTKNFCMKILQDLVPLLQHPQLQLRATTALSQVMESYPLSPYIHLESLRMLNAVLDESVSKEVADEAIECSLASILSFPDEHGAHCLGIDLLRTLKVHLINGDENVRATRIIFESQKKHIKVLFLQQVSLCLLAWLVEELRCRQCIKSLDGPQSIVQAMVEHPMDCMIQCNATAIICWIVHGIPHEDVGWLSQNAPQDNGISIQNNVFIEWAFPIILSTLTQYFTEASVFGNCICLLAGIPNLPCQMILLDLIQLGMKSHRTSSKVQEACLRWLKYSNPHLHSMRIIRCIPVILEAMKEHSSDRNVQAQACEVLIMLLGERAAREAVLEQGAVEFVMAALSLHENDLPLQHSAIWFFALLLSSNEEAEHRLEATLAFGGGLLALETMWKSLKKP